MQINCSAGNTRPAWRLVTKMILAMKLTVILLTVAMASVHAAGLSQTITYSGRSVNLEKLFKVIEQQSGYVVLYNPVLVKKSKPVSIQADHMALTDFLSAMLQNEPLEYSIENKNIIISPAKVVATASPQAPKQVVETATGLVTTAEGEPLQGASVTVSDSKQTTTTDKQGRFSIPVSPGDVLIISFVGFSPRELIITAENIQRAFIISLSRKQSVLDEMVVQAYGVTSKRIGTGNIDKVKGEELNKAPVINPLAALQGRVAGVNITQMSGVPGAGFRVQIRGRTRLDKTYGATDEPLYILDGVPLATGNDRISRITSAIGQAGADLGLSPFNTINMADIESIEILKDADATAIYGSRGANGVVLITTKKAKAGNTRMNLNVKSGFSKAPLPDLLSTKEYVAMRLEAFKNDNKIPDNSNAYDIKLWDSTRDQNLPKQLIGGTAQFLSAQASLSGGTQQAQYLVGAGYTRETDVYPGTMPNTRFSSHFAINTVSANQKFNAQFTGNFTSATNKTVQTDLSSKLNLPPNFLLYDSVGKLAWNEGGVTVVDNPLAILLNRYTAKQDNLSANTQLSYRLLPQLVLRTSIGYNQVTVDEVAINPIAGQNPVTPNPTGRSQFGNNSFKSWIIEPQAEYTTYFGKGRFNALVGGTMQSQKNDGRNMTVSNYTSDEFLGSLTGTTGTSVTFMQSNLNEYKYSAFFGRMNYNYDNRYIVNLSGRRDGSSRFGPNYRVSNFGAVGAAWLFGSERFMRSIPFISYAKLRGSYGVTGNDKIGDYKYLDAYTADPFAPTYQDSAALIPSGLFKPDLHWEKSVKLEFGLELGFVKDRILLSAAWYRNRTSDPLVSYPLPAATGFTTIQANLAGVLIDNTGVELSVNSMNIRTKNFEWTTNLNLTIPKNKLVAFPNLDQSSYATKAVVGRSLNIVYVGRFLGVDPKTGLGMVEDRNNNGTFSVTEDGSFLLDTDPDYYGGLQNTIRYKGFSIDFLLQFTKQMNKNWFGSLATSGFSFIPIGGMQNLPHVTLQRWQQEGDMTSIQKFTTTNSASNSLNGNYNLQFTDLSYTDASYLRLKNISLSYTMPSKWLQKAKLANVNVFVQGQNLLTFTPFKSTDPETTYLFTLPPLRTFTAGFQFTL